MKRAVEFQRRAIKPAGGIIWHGDAGGRLRVHVPVIRQHHLPRVRTRAWLLVNDAVIGQVHREKAVVVGHAAGISFNLVDLSGLNVSSGALGGFKAHGADMSRIVLAGTDLRGADLRQADLVNADLRHADLTGALLDGADLTGANLSGAMFLNASLCGAAMPTCVLARTDFTGANLSGAWLAGSDLSDTVFDQVNLAGANLSGARCVPASMIAVNLSGTCLFPNPELGSWPLPAEFMAMNLQPAIMALARFRDGLSDHERLAFTGIMTGRMNRTLPEAASRRLRSDPMLLSLVLADSSDGPLAGIMGVLMAMDPVVEDIPAIPEMDELACRRDPGPFPAYGTP